MNKQFHGVVVPMVTPITPNGAIDTAAVARLVEHLAQAGVSPLLMGTTGEGSSVSTADGALIAKQALQTAAGRVKVYAALTGNCISEQKRQADNYASLGVDALVATLPCYYQLTPGQMYDYYSSIADYCKVPFLLYNILATTYMSIPVDVVRRLADHPNIVGLKDSERNEQRQAEILSFCADRTDFSYFCGCAALSSNALSLGADGIVPSGGNLIPETYQRLYEAGARGDKAESDRLQEVTNSVCQNYQKGFTLGESLAALKVMLGTRGLCGPDMLPPLTRLTPEQESTLTEAATKITLQ